MLKHVFMSLKLFLLCGLLLNISLCLEHDEDKIRDLINNEFLTWTATVRIRNKELGYHLHSHPIAYGSGSGQQAVTGLESATDVGSLWLIKEADGDKMCLTGEPILCGSTIRLEHTGTGRNLHSHDFESPVSKRTEVSGFGEDGVGDDGDNWIIECREETNGEKVKGRSQFYLKHKKSGNYLYADRRSMFNRHNCMNCPIIGQAEVSGTKAKNINGIWEIVGGYFFDHDDQGDFGLGEKVEEINDYSEDYNKEDL